ncbi:MAG: hypothetical protein ACLQVF_29495 [Isosphaeraceae bacterium]
MNAITELKTMSLNSSDGPVAAIIIGLKITDPEDADLFLVEVAEKFKHQRASSPTETSFLLITIAGAMTAARFANEWLKLAAGDQVLGSIMATMKKAEVLRGTDGGQTLETVSLLKAPPA